MLNIRFFLNPFFVYIASFLLCLLVYQLYWSSLTPTLTSPVYLFFIITFLFSFILGILLNFKIKEYDYQVTSHPTYIFITLLIVLGYIIEFAHAGGVPLLMVLSGINYDYRDFGIKSFHVFLHTFCGFYSLYIFHQYFDSPKNYKLLVCLLILISMHLLIVNRGSLFFILLQASILALIKLKFLQFKYLLIGLPSLLLFLYFFGWIGNVRSGHSTDHYIPTTTGASEDFMEGNVPREYYWTYLYMASPVANFQKAVLHRNTFPSTEEKAVALIENLLPDVLSKRITGVLNISKLEHQYWIHPVLIVSTAFYDIFLYLGWFGAYLLFFFFAAIIFFYFKFTPAKSRYFLSGWAILVSIVIFNTFDNMWAFSGLSLQFIYVLFFMFLEKYKFVL